MPWLNLPRSLPSFLFSSSRGSYQPVDLELNGSSSPVTQTHGSRGRSGSNINGSTSHYKLRRPGCPTRPRWIIAGALLILLLGGAFHFRKHPLAEQLRASAEAKLGFGGGAGSADLAGVVGDGVDTGAVDSLKGSPAKSPAESVPKKPTGSSSKGGRPEWPAQWPPGEEEMNGTDWTRFAYTQYVTDTHYLCNSLMLFESLHRLGSRADRLMMYPADMELSDKGSTEARLLLKARDEYNVKLEKVQVLHHNEREGTWADSFTKLLAFNQTQYDRVLNLDSDSTILQPMDELFLLPHTPVAMPLAYWGDKVQFSSQLLLIEPSKAEWTKVQHAFDVVDQGRYDMEIVNDLYASSALIVPHRGYDLLTGEFRATDHTAYLGSEEEEWDPQAMLSEAKYLHFSDWPVPKPWIKASANVLEQNQPQCLDPNAGHEAGHHDDDSGGVDTYHKSRGEVRQINDDSSSAENASDCEERRIWLHFYSDFAARRKRICGFALNPDRKRRRRRSPNTLKSANVGV